MMRFPKMHVADAVASRIMNAAKQINGGSGAKAMPKEKPAAEMPMEMPDNPPMAMPQSMAPVPGLNESGLDIGAVLSGADSIDALLKGGMNG